MQHLAVWKVCHVLSAVFPAAYRLALMIMKCFQFSECTMLMCSARIPISFYFTDSQVLLTCVLQQCFLMFRVDLGGPPSPLHCYRTQYMFLLVLTVLYHSGLNMYSFSSIDCKLFQGRYHVLFIFLALALSNSQYIILNKCLFLILKDNYPPLTRK